VSLDKRSRLVVVSYIASDVLSPRGIRTQRVLAELHRHCAVELVAGPPPAARRAAPGYASALKQSIRPLVASLLLDRLEFWSRRRFRSWRPSADAALLIGAPFSPLAAASGRLIEAGVPYVVDAGDPWALTARAPAIRGPALARARRTEFAMWSHAVGGIVTTDLQADRLRNLFPRLPILVRPNGFDPTPEPAESAAVCAENGKPRWRPLRLAHFGNLYEPRLDPVPFLHALAVSGLWPVVEFHQFGFDWSSTLTGLQPNVKVTFHEPRRWAEIVGIAPQFDAAVVIGNRDPGQLPSKTVDYLQLPIPRLALVCERDGDAVAHYVAGKSGWLVVDGADTRVPAAVQQHVDRDWAPAALAPPSSERWERVAAEVGAFVLERLRLADT
jgi:hypothetical protein